MRRTCPQCGSVLPPGVRAEFCPVCVLRDAREPGPAAEVLGDYELFEEIGRGGMGVVWRARQRSLGRIVAVKVVLGGDFASESARERFRAEAQAVARLQHPHIVAIHEIGEHDGLPFFSMDYIDGSTLADLARAQPLPGGRAAGIAREIAVAVQHAHERGVLHRDLKPSNIIIDSTGAPRITDFGLAKLLDSDANLTLTAQALGSPAYMSPEQARHGPVTAASDVYSMGAVLYHLLTGRPPFQGDSVATVLAQVENTEPLAPRGLNPSLPADLQNICLKCLQKNPTHRYATARSLADDLARFLAGKPVDARPISKLAVISRWSRRHPALAGLWAALAALAIISTIAALSVQRANVRATASLRESLLAQARSTRLAALPGHRARVFAAVSRAMALRPGPAERVLLRSEIMSSLSLLDARFEPMRTLPSIPDFTRVTFDAEHELCAHAGPQGPVIVCRLHDGVELHRFHCAPRRVWNVIAFSPDRRFLLIRDPKNLCVFEIATGRLCVEWPASLNQGVFAHDSSAVAIAGRDGQMVIFDLVSGAQRQRWSSKADAIAGSPDGGLLACATPDGIELREFGTGALRRVVPVVGAIRTLAWSADAMWLAAGAASGEITLWDATTGLFIRRFDGHHGALRCVAFDATRSLLASASADGTVRLWELHSQRPSLNVSLQSYGLTFNRDGSQLGPLWAFGPTGILALARPAGFVSLRSEPAVESRFSIAWSPDGRWVAAAGGEGVRVWEASSHRLLASEPTMTESVAFDPRAGILAVGTPAGVRCYALPNDPSEPLRLMDHLFERNGSPGVCFSQDGARFAVARDAHGTIDVFLRDQKTPEVSLRNEMQFSAVALSPNGGLVAGSAEWGADRVRVWKTADGSRIAELKTEGALRSAFSPDGQWLATFGARPQLWETATWKSGPSIDLGLRNELAGCGAFSHDGKLLVVLLGAGIPHLLALHPGGEPELVAVLESQVSPSVRAVAFSADGRHLAGVGPLGQVEIWDFHALRAHLREHALDWSF